MSTPNNTGYIDGVFTRNYPNVAANVINSGDLVYVDQTTYDVKALDSDANALYNCGVSEDTTPIGAYPNEPAPYHGMNVARQAVRKLILADNDVVVPGGPVYYGGDAQVVTNVSGNNLVANLYNNPDGSYAAGVTGDGETQYLFVLYSRL
jgi:hypothetical protein